MIYDDISVKRNDLFTFMNGFIRKLYYSLLNYQPHGAVDLFSSLIELLYTYNTTRLKESFTDNIVF